MRLTITGFGPFPGIPKNPSATLARRLAGDARLARHDIVATVRILPTIYAGTEERIAAILADTRPEAILMFGVAGRRRHVSVEVRALNRVSILAPDAKGCRPSRMTLAPGASLVRRGRAPMARLAVAGRRSGMPSRLSINAGKYLCNASYHAMLGATPATVPCVFIHIPKVRGKAGMDRLLNAARAMALGLVRM